MDFTFSGEQAATLVILSAVPLAALTVASIKRIIGIIKLFSRKRIDLFRGSDTYMLLSSTVVILLTAAVIASCYRTFSKAIFIILVTEGCVYIFIYCVYHIIKYFTFREKVR